MLIIIHIITIITFSPHRKSALYFFPKILLWIYKIKLKFLYNAKYDARDFHSIKKPDLPKSMYSQVQNESIIYPDIYLQNWNVAQIQWLQAETNQCPLIWLKAFLILENWRPINTKEGKKSDFSTEHNNICFFNHSWIKEKTWSSGGVYVKISSLTQWSYNNFCRSWDISLVELFAKENWWAWKQIEQ